MPSGGIVNQVVRYGGMNREGENTIMQDYCFEKGNFEIAKPMK